MKSIMEQYGRVVIAACIALALFSIFEGVFFQNRQNMPIQIGKIIESNAKNSIHTNNTGKKFEKIMNHSKPRIISKKTEFVKNQVVDLSEIIVASDENGKLLESMIKNIWNEEFQTSSAIVVKEESKLSFEEDGIYWMEVCAVDKEGYSSNALVKLFVSER